LHNSFSAYGKRWWFDYVKGAQHELLMGIAGTTDHLAGHFAECFPLDTTVILGDSGQRPPFNSDPKTIARWSLPTSKYTEHAEQFSAYLLIGCLRRFGGLHSPTFNDRAVILLNDKVVDGFELKERPDGHQDYFHTEDYPSIPRPYPFSECKTVYSWSIPLNHFVWSGTQRLEIRLDKDTKWDIDYVGLLLEVPVSRHRLFISYHHGDRPMARRLAEDLRRQGVRVWIDEKEMKLGDSLLEKIREAIDTVDYVICLLSRGSLSSSWVNKELSIALMHEIEGKRVKVMIIRIEDVPVPSLLAEKIYADLLREEDYGNVLEQITRRIEED
jgi:hypothetical protein